GCQGQAEHRQQYQQAHGGGNSAATESAQDQIETNQDENQRPQLPQRAPQLPAEDAQVLEQQDDADGNQQQRPHQAAAPAPVASIGGRGSLGGGERAGHDQALQSERRKSSAAPSTISTTAQATCQLIQRKSPAWAVKNSRPRAINTMPAERRLRARCSPYQSSLGP